MRFINLAKGIIIAVVLAVIFSFSFNPADSLAQNKDTKTGQNQTTTTSNPTKKKKHKRHHRKHKKHKKTKKTETKTDANKK